MTAKQTLSASLAVLLSAPLAVAEPDAPQPSGEVHPEPQPPPGETKPIELMPERAPTGTFSVGAGYSSDDGFGFGARIAQSDLFLTGKMLSMDTRLTERWQDFRIAFEDPALLGTSFRLTAELLSRRERFSTFTRDAVGAALTLKRRIAPGLDVFAGYKIEEVEVEHTTSLRTLDPTPQWAGGILAAVRAGIAYSSVEHELGYPARGTSAGASIEIADRDLGSSINYTRTDAYLSHHRPIGPFTLHVGGRVAAISESAPMSERLHFDGSRDIRGYAPGELMPTGANLKWSARAELEAPLVPIAGISVVGFADAGGLYTRRDAVEAASLGFGLIWRSPIGPLRFDWAYPTDGDGGARFVVGVGGMF